MSNFTHCVKPFSIQHLGGVHITSRFICFIFIQKYPRELQSRSHSYPTIKRNHGRVERIVVDSSKQFKFFLIERTHIELSLNSLQNGIMEKTMCPSQNLQTVRFFVWLVLFMKNVHALKYMVRSCMTFVSILNARSLAGYRVPHRLELHTLSNLIESCHKHCRSNVTRSITNHCQG